MQNERLAEELASLGRERLGIVALVLGWHRQDWQSRFGDWWRQTPSYPLREQVVLRELFPSARLGVVLYDELSGTPCPRLEYLLHRLGSGVDWPATWLKLAQQHKWQGEVRHTSRLVPLGAGAVVEVVESPTLAVGWTDATATTDGADLDGWLVEIPNVLPRLAELASSEAQPDNGQTTTVAPRPGRAWKDGPPPTGWHPDYIEGKLEELVRVAGVRDKKTLLRYNGKSWWIWKRSGRQFRLYARNASEYAHWKRKWLASVKADEKG